MRKTLIIIQRNLYKYEKYKRLLNMKDRKFGFGMYKDCTYYEMRNMSKYIKWILTLDDKRNFYDFLSFLKIVLNYNIHF